MLCRGCVFNFSLVYPLIVHRHLGKLGVAWVAAAVPKSTNQKEVTYVLFADSVWSRIPRSCDNAICARKVWVPTFEKEYGIIRNFAQLSRHVYVYQ